MNTFEGLVASLEGHSRWEEQSLFAHAAAASSAFADSAVPLLTAQHKKWDALSHQVTSAADAAWQQIKPVFFAYLPYEGERPLVMMPLLPHDRTLLEARALELLALLEENNRQLRLHLQTEEEAVVPVWLELDLVDNKLPDQAKESRDETKETTEGPEPAAGQEGSG